ncbi:uncharacterized protein M6B38_410805 [Iris pallida]|uniref:Histone acetyltransferase n=1 Tax=Iris pallida TaxID=29817 RepID=A0AAX6FMD6_IRIPA|nr:uncharacterized protein M6B38_410805 [Iris pallida]
MPRPGPRPYECVRRAWHSDRHQPVRGSLIQEIFSSIQVNSRVANQVHNPRTQKNKEWQEKMPMVVLKAEEVMYSKANSEAEYMDLKTLWERTNDAIDTIIRRDDTTEAEGDLLQPCIEAALNLGCIPRRASRSQHHNNPGCYLSSTTGGESTTAAASFLKIPDINMLVGKHLGSSTCSLPRPPPILYPGSATIPFPSQFETWTVAGVNHSDSNVLSLVPDAGFGPNDPISVSAPSPDTIVPWQSTIGLSVPVGTYTWPRFGCVYHLCYNDEQPNPSTHLPFLKPPEPSTSAIPVPCLPSICEAGMDCLHNFLCLDNAAGASNTSSNFEEGSENRPGVVCDLSLRLGLSPPPSLDAKSVWTQEVEDVGSSSSYNNGSKFSCPSRSRTRVINFGSSFSSSKDEGCDFFLVGATDGPLESCSSQRSSGRFGCF